MFFSIKGVAYTVAVSPRPLFFKGQPCKARVDSARRKIWISDQVPAHERRRELFHELRHCWIWAHGVAEDAEADADQAAEMMDAMLQQFVDQGGDHALEQLAPDPEQTKSLSRVVNGPLANVRFDCGACGCIVAIGSIANGKPEWSAEAGIHLMDRGMHCPACDRITVWREACTPEGLPLGAIVAFPPPRVLRGDEAGRWFAEHADVCNVAV